jgi:hypothetical protein
VICGRPAQADIPLQSDIYLRPAEVDMIRIWLIAMLAAALLVVVRNTDLLHATGLLHSCSTVPAPSGRHGSWHACRKGLLNGRADLSGQACHSEGHAGSREYWRCPARLR